MAQIQIEKIYVLVVVAAVVVVIHVVMTVDAVVVAVVVVVVVVVIVGVAFVVDQVFAKHFLRSVLPLPFDSQLKTNSKLLIRVEFVRCCCCCCCCCCF